MNSLFLDIGLIIIIVGVCAYLVKLLKQPLIPIYILVGLVLGPMYGLITNDALIHTLSEFGIAFLLFIVGLEIELKKLKNVSLVASLGGFLKSVILFFVGFLVFMSLGFVYKEAIYIGIIIAISSTMVVVKVLSDKSQINTLHGRIVVGILLMEDIIAIFALSMLNNLGNFALVPFINSILNAILLISIAYLSAKFVFPILFKISAKSQELLFLSALTVCFVFSLLANYLQMSVAIGAFLAGVTLGNLRYSTEIINRIKPLRDFFVIIFFVSLGMSLDFISVKSVIKPLIILIVLVIVLKPIIIMALCSMFGYKKRPSFLSALTLTQVSEFSLIIAAQGIILGNISSDILTMTILLAIITITTTTYLTKFENGLYRLLKPFLKIFEKLSLFHVHYREDSDKMDYEVVLCGYNRIGYSIVKTLKKLKKKFLIIDYNPEIVKDMIDSKIPCIYGDVADSEILDKINFRKIKLLISTVPNIRDNLLLIRRLRTKNKKATVFVTADQVDEALELYDAGAGYVILPHFLGGEYVSLLVENSHTNFNRIIKSKLRHIKELQKRKDLGHEHPKHH